MNVGIRNSTVAGLRRATLVRRAVPVRIASLVRSVSPVRSASFVRFVSIAALLLPSTAVAQEAPPSLDAFPHDPALFAVLAMEPGPAQVDSVGAYAGRVPFDVADTLAMIAEDPAIHPLLRANATLLIARRKDVAHFIIFRPLLEADDPRIRLAVVMGIQEFLPALPVETLSVLRVALRDPEPAVQARALEAMTDRDVDALRAYLETDPRPELRSVAEGLIAAGERRGAPLVPQANGTLVRTGPQGDRLIYTPTSDWPGEDLSAGTLTLETADGRTLELGQRIEVARNVVPAFFSADGSRVVLERDRSIHVFDTESGATRTVGPGIAPRPLPFTESFVYAVPVQDMRTEVRGETRTEYDLRMASFDGSTGPESVETIRAVMSFGVSGGASPLRWMRVTEEGGFFSLRGEGMDPVPLPDPFGGAGG